MITVRNNTLVSSIIQNIQGSGEGFMNYIEAVQLAMNTIDQRITENITLRELANTTNFSVYHFSRIFTGIIGKSAMSYITHRKLQYAIYDICNGKKIIDAAMEYGFETHAGFTKAFKKFYGCTPSYFRLHISSNTPSPVNVSNITKLYGGKFMEPIIIHQDVLPVIGYQSQHNFPNVKHTSDIPAFWNTINMDYGSSLTHLHQIFAKSKHCECSICYNVDEVKGDFTYLLGVGVDHSDDLKLIEGDMTRIDIPEGLYAKFTTPLSDSDNYPSFIEDTWRYILTEWLPNSQYMIDETRYDYEYYDERDHASENNNLIQMDIVIPIMKKE